MTLTRQQLRLIQRKNNKLARSLEKEDVPDGFKGKEAAHFIKGAFQNLSKNVRKERQHAEEKALHVMLALGLNSNANRFAAVIAKMPDALLFSQTPVQLFKYVNDKIMSDDVNGLNTN